MGRRYHHGTKWSIAAIKQQWLWCSYSGPSHENMLHFTSTDLGGYLNVCQSAFSSCQAVEHQRMFSIFVSKSDVKRSYRCSVMYCTWHSEALCHMVLEKVQVQCDVLYLTQWGTLPHGPRGERYSVCAKRVGTEKSENGVSSSTLIINFMSVTHHYITANVFVIFWWW
jgi:hypothetical protein